jgi:hypothetical protein
VFTTAGLYSLSQTRWNRCTPLPNIYLKYFKGISTGLQASRVRTLLNVHTLTIYNSSLYSTIQLKTPWPESASELYWPSDRRMSAKWLPTFADKECHVVSLTDPRILDFLDRSRYFFYQVAPQLYSRGKVVPVPDALIFFLCSAGNGTRASGPVARNSDH